MGLRGKSFATSVRGHQNFTVQQPDYPGHQQQDEEDEQAEQDHF